MSLITCCPACQTMFKVSGEDLRVSDGWVRCGNCDGVFDASAHLQVMPEQAEAAPRSDPVPISPLPGALGSRTSPGTVPAPSAVSTQTFPVSERPSLFRSATIGDDSDYASRPEDVSDQAEFADAANVPSSPVLRQEDRSSWREDGQSVEYLPGSVRSRSMPKPLVWGLVTLILAAALLGWARHERQMLVQRMPSLLGAFEKLCQISGCEVQAPKLLQAVLIDGAMLEGVGPAQYKVQLTLRNTGGVALAVPALDVSLTGLQGEVLVRHTVLPSEFAPGLLRLLPGAQQTVSFMVAGPALPQAAEAPSASPAAPASAAFESSTATAIPTLPAAEPVLAPSISGYRVIAFYP